MMTIFYTHFILVFQLDFHSFYQPNKYFDTNSVHICIVGPNPRLNGYMKHSDAYLRQKEVK